MWYRVFGLNDAPPDLAALLEHLHAAGLPAVAHFRGDDLGWTGGELVLGEAAVTVERYLAKEDDLRDDLNTWAGWLETRADQPRHGELMQHVIGTKQLITVRRPPDVALDRLCDEVHVLNRRLDAGDQLLRIARELTTLNESLQALAYAALGQQAPTVRRRRTG